MWLAERRQGTGSSDDALAFAARWRSAAKSCAFFATYSQIRVAPAVKVGV
jgi:hypothetical protein